MSEDAVTEQVRALEAMNLLDLRAEWKRRRLGPPPRLRSPEVLRRLLAWRMQVEAWGGLDEVTRRKLRETKAPRGVDLSPGAEVTREWEGVVHKVQVVEGGFLHDGARHASLSAVARTITGVNWNGPRFFGLRASTEKGAGA